jgi:sn-glycerol 3-phosphate transport system permease protein
MASVASGRALEPDSRYLLQLRLKRIGGRVLAYAFLIVLCVAIGAPLFWMATGAFKTNKEIFTYPPVWWPELLRWTSLSDVSDAWVNFRSAWDRAPFGRWYLNSIIITLAGMGLELMFATTTAYALAFLRFPAKNLVFVLILAALMVPTQVTILPNYLTIADVLGTGTTWINSYQGIIIPGAATAYGTFLMRQSFLGLPREVMEAAKIDGVGHLRMLWDIVIPMSRPVLITFALISMVAKWNDYLWPLIVTNGDDMRPLTVGIAKLYDQEGTSNTDWGVVMAATIFVIAPLLVIYLWAQRYIIEGITAGATKG